jgi:hypothetical protein
MATKKIKGNVPGINYDRQKKNAYESISDCYTAKELVEQLELISEECDTDMSEMELEFDYNASVSFKRDEDDQEYTSRIFAEEQRMDYQNKQRAAELKKKQARDAKKKATEYQTFLKLKAKYEEGVETT